MTRDHFFGARHTDDKLDRLFSYMKVFNTALKNQGFRLIYIDAFAGSGNRAETLPALPLLGTDSEIITVPGSARIALSVEPPFDQIILIEKDPGRFESLQILTSGNENVVLHHGDANDAVCKLCSAVEWHLPKEIGKATRGVLFLDPYGMEVDWSTIEAVARTQAIDMWCFFPLSGLYRQAAREKIRITPDKRHRLNASLGTAEWESIWYETPHGPSNLFGDDATEIRTADVSKIESYVRERLATIFAGGVLPPRRIYNSRGAPIASLFFAISNPHPKAAALARKFATHILKR